MGYSERFDRAVAWAVRDFRSVTRKGTEVPYITHLFAVTARVGEAGGDEDQLIAAVLHDWLEDVRGASEKALEAEFGPRVAGMVVALSDTTEFPNRPGVVEKKPTSLIFVSSRTRSSSLVRATSSTTHRRWCET